MAAIEIPPSYWNVRDAGFRALVQPFGDALDDVHRDVVAAHTGLELSDRTDAATALGEMDADAGLINTAIADEHGDVTSTPTGDVLGNYANADGLTATADASRPVESPTDPPHSRIVVPPPPLPHGEPPPDTPPVGTGVPRDPTNPGPPTAIPRPVPAPPSPPVPAPEPPPFGPSPPVGPDVPNTAPPREGPPQGPPPGDEPPLPPEPDVPVGPNVGPARDLLPAEPAPVAPPAPVVDPPVTRTELLELLSNLDFTINLQV